MPASLFDGRIWRDLLGDPQAAQLFTEGAEIRAILIVWGAVAEAQAAEGRIPETAARAIARAAREAEVDPAALAEGTARDGTPLPALADAFRAEIGAPEHGQWIGRGVAHDHVEDTALALRLRQALTLADERLALLDRSMQDRRDRLAERRPVILAVAPFADADLARRLAVDLRLGKPTEEDSLCLLARWLIEATSFGAKRNPDPHGLGEAIAMSQVAAVPAMSHGDRMTRRLLLPGLVLGTLRVLRTDG